VPTLDWPAEDEFGNWRSHGDSPLALVVTAIARAWKSSISDVLRASDLHGYDFNGNSRLEVGTVEGKPVVSDVVAILRNPKEAPRAKERVSTSSRGKKKQ
jgi:hypothetical protein